MKLKFTTPLCIEAEPHPQQRIDDMDYPKPRLRLCFFIATCFIGFLFLWAF